MNSIKEKRINLLKIENGPLKDKIKESELTKKVIEKLELIPDLKDFKGNISLTSLIASLIENYVNNSTKFGYKKSKTVDKEKCLLTIMESLFSDESEEFKNMLHEQITYLHSHNLIKKIKLSAVVFDFVKNWVSKNFL